MTFSRRVSLVLVLLALAFPASAEWYDDYFEGIEAAEKKNWSVVIQKMNAAIAEKPKEEKKAKTYGVQFIAYHPYYYLGVAYLNEGNWAKAVENLKKTSGVGKLNLGDPNTLLITANQHLAAEQIRSQPSTPPPSQPAAPAAPAGPDPQLVAARERASEAIQNARTRFNRSQQKDAAIHAPSEFDAASDLFRQATSLNVNASTIADYGHVADLADRAARGFDAAVTSAQLKVAELERQRRAQQQRPQTPTQQPVTTQQPPPSRATDDALADTKQRLRQALQAYFDGDFRTSASQLQQLTLDQPNNAMIYAFLGAAQYYDYYLRGQSDASALERAKNALRQARAINPSLTLDSNYFSARIRNFYEQIE